MRASWLNRNVLAALSIAVALGSPLAAAQARTPRAHSAVTAIHAGMRFANAHHRFGHGFHIRRYGSVLQCVPFARENSGIELSGNAGTWWNSAAGTYERGAKPEVGSILNFRSTGHMPSGHVAVVTNVLNARHIEIDHANWSGPGRISRNMDVVDVSPANDWTEVRVAFGNGDAGFGGVYPTYGFIYDRPDSGTLVANAGVQEKGAGAATPMTPSEPEEVAEAPDDDAMPSSPGRHRVYRVSHRAWAHAGHHAWGNASLRTVSTHIRPSPAHHRRHI